MTSHITCPQCHGGGRVPNDDPSGDPRVRVWCPQCGGAGTVDVSGTASTGDRWRGEPDCPDCKGRGAYCSTCRKAPEECECPVVGPYPGGRCWIACPRCYPDVGGGG